MSSPAIRGPTTPKRHPACPGGRRCQLQGCIHNATSRFSTDGISLALYEVNGMFGAYSFVRFAGGWLYQQLDAASERTNVRGVDDEANAAIGNPVYVAQTKIREVSGIILNRIRSYLDSEITV